MSTSTMRILSDTLSGMVRSRLAAVLLALLMAISACGGESRAICAPTDGRSVARIWNEVLLEAVRADTPAPTVHARNLFHTSAAMWDAWSAHTGEGTAVFLQLQRNEDDVAAAEVALSHAAHAVLTERYRNSVGGVESLAAFDRTLDELCLDPVDADKSGPAADGRAIAAHILDATIDDGSFELDGYLDLTYFPQNQPLLVAERGVPVDAPDSWQPLQLNESITQNDQSQLVGLQSYIGPHWGFVLPFAMEPSDDGLPIDPGAPPRLDQAEDRDRLDRELIEVIRLQAGLDERLGEPIDISPATRGNNTLGADDGSGHSVNPITGAAYEATMVSSADYGRVVAEYWADGPRSETPPGHWNVLANEVSDALATPLMADDGAELTRLQWDLRMYLALNGAMHDAAIAAWGAKRSYDSARPISLIRHRAALGQSSEPDAAAFHPDGLPLVDGLIELVTDDSADRHGDLPAGTIAILAWAGHPTLHGSADEVRWIDGRTWVPYQLDTFVTPSFPGYVSGHSTFSRAGAVVLEALTGSAYFPNGLGTFTAPAGSLRFDDGPATDVTLQWATYADAADEAGRSRLYGGIHISADDLEGRRIGQVVGEASLALARSHF